MSFKDIRLQDRPVGFLKNSIKNKRLSHSLLFAGPESVGKGLAALTLAKSLNCETAPPADCCDSCTSCRKIDNFNHPDVSWIEPEGAGGVVKIEKIRRMRGAINLKPFEGKAKVFIIDKAHLLTGEAANSSLKILEEPPPDSFIILITDDLNGVFPTVRSRCQWVLFSPVSPGFLKGFLTREYGLKEEEAHFLSHQSEGRIGRALRMKKEGSLEWKNSVIDRFFEKSSIPEEDPFFFGKKKDELLDMMDVLVNWHRDIFILKSGAGDSLLVNIDRIADLKKKAASMTLKSSIDILKEMLKSRFYIERMVNPKLVLTDLALSTIGDA